MKSNQIFTFWEGRMPAYIRFCLSTWNFPYTVLNYKNLNDFTKLDIEAISRYPLPQVSDIVRAHVIRDHGGHWLDADTIVIGDRLPSENVIGDPDTRWCHTGICCGEKGDPFFTAWAAYQDGIIGNERTGWSMFVNDFTDPYIKAHEEVTIYDIRRCCPELDAYVLWNDEIRYQNYYFRENRHLKDLPEGTEILALHNSWTPAAFKELPAHLVLFENCTMSNILREVNNAKK